MSDPILSKAIARGFYPESKGFKESKPEQVLRDAAGSLSRLLWARPWRLKAFVRRVNSLGHPLREKDDSALAGEVAEVRREARSAGLTVESAAMAFALAREFSHRHLGMRHFDVQIMGGLALLKGMVAEMQTGEGKTLTATLPACAAAVAGIPVHIITVNDYLAQRDAVWMAPLYRAMGLSVGSITHDMGLEERRGAYGCDVLYCSNKEIVFDYLKDRLVMKRRPGEIQVRLQRLADSDATFGQIRLRGLPFAIVDEADSVLIDEARTPLIISGQADDGVEARTYREALDLAGRMEEGRDYTVDQIRKHLDLTEEGCFRLEEFAGQLGGVWAGRKRREEVVRQALSAIHLYERDRDYIVRDDRVQIVDEYTGRVMADRSWERGLHQLIEAKEECKITSRSETLARISYQRFFRRYHHMAGMTGTAREVAGELWSVYRLQVITIPTNRETVRRKLPSKVYRDADERWRQVVDRIKELHEQGRPVLVGTRSVASSDRLSNLLDEADIAHRILNARQDAQEAEIIAEAGQRGKVTVATNMAGRGTDIKLGPGVVDLGGLHVLATEYHDARRIDRQLFGRCGRQGDPGSYEMMACLEDHFIATFRGSISGRMAGIITGRDSALAHKLGDIFAASAQRRAQRKYFIARKELLRFDESLETAMAFSGQGE
jgi:preprotein translocase subunit SecA